MLRVVYACSGCADLGEVADRVSRSLRKTGFVKTKKNCLTGIGLGIQDFINAAKEADEVLAIDGCEVTCAKRTLEKAGISTNSFVLTEMGFVKGGTPHSEAVVETICRRVIESF
ncbi:MAG: zinc-binding protein [Firmicutes bacterium]|nr:zinc-binding protein [Bacillota bacterium]